MTISGKFRKWLTVLAVFSGPGLCFAQDSTLVKKDTLNFRGDVSVTNNGFSFIPAFTLGKPAAILDLSLSWKRFSIEPQFRFSLEGKPWGFVFIYRYKVIMKKRFLFSVGSHLPGMPFTEKTVTSGGVTTTKITANLYVVGELIPTYFITPNTSVGLYYLASHGLEDDAIQYSHFLSVRAGFTRVKLSKRLRMNFRPELFYLKLDEQDGYYCSADLLIGTPDFPVVFGARMYKAFETTIGGKDFDWNISLIYTYSRRFVAQ